MSFKVKFTSGTGHDDHDEANGGPNESTYTFKTKGERTAFLKGVRVTNDAMIGWIDAWVETENIK